MDEEIMNRPFYWHYMTKMNRPGDPMQLLFTNTSHSKEGGIYLHAGTPKLHTIYGAAIKKGKTARLCFQIDQVLSEFVYRMNLRGCVLRYGQGRLPHF